MKSDSFGGVFAKALIFLNLILVVLNGDWEFDVAMS